MGDPLADAGLTPTPVEEDNKTAVDPQNEEKIDVPEGAENPDAVRNAIRNERKAAREANARARELEAEIRERESREKPLEAQLSEQQSLREAAELRALRYEVAAEAGLAPSFATRLVGDSREALLADAATFREQIGDKPRPAPAVAPEGGVRAPAGPPGMSRQEVRTAVRNKDTAALRRAEEGHAALIAAITSGRQDGGSLFSGLTPAPEDDE